MMPAKSVHCSTCAHRARSVFRSLEGEALRRLDGGKVVQFYPRGQRIFHEGGPPLAIHCVHAGHVRLSKSVPHTDDVVVRIAGPGDTLGLSAMLASEPYEVTAEAIEDAAVCTIAKDTVDELLETGPTLANEILGMLARELRASEETTVEFAHRRVPQRLAHLLLDLVPARETCMPENGDTRVHVRRTEMARMIGASPETVSRLLHRLESRGIVRLTRTDVELLDLEALQGIAKGHLI